MEHTGDYYSCIGGCEHIWDYNDDACPECGSKQFEDVNVDYIKSTFESQTSDYRAYLEDMLDSHDDLRPKQQ